MRSARHPSGEKRAKALWIAAQKSLTVRAAALCRIDLRFAKAPNRVELRRVGREVQKPGSGCLDRLAHTGHSMDAEIVQMSMSPGVGFGTSI